MLSGGAYRHMSERFNVCRCGSGGLCIVVIIVTETHSMVVIFLGWGHRGGDSCNGIN